MTILTTITLLRAAASQLRDAERAVVNPSDREFELSETMEWTSTAAQLEETAREMETNSEPQLEGVITINPLLAELMEQGGHTIPPHVKVVSGISLTEHLQKAGSAKSDVKTASSRANGAKGGRPRKNPKK
jgi:hypothetical protein